MTDDNELMMSMCISHLATCIEILRAHGRVNKPDVVQLTRAFLEELMRAAYTSQEYTPLVESAMLFEARTPQEVVDTMAFVMQQLIDALDTETCTFATEPTIRWARKMPDFEYHADCEYYEDWPSKVESN